MSKLSVFYKKHFKIKVFNKILLTYSIITALTLLLLSFFVINTFNETTKKNELETNRRILDSVNNYLDAKYYSSQNIIQQLYINEDEITDMIYFLNNDYLSYITHKLDKYFLSNSFIFKGVDNYIKTCFAQDSDIQNIIIYSNEKDFLYMCDSSLNKQYITKDSLSSTKIERDNIVKPSPVNLYNEFSTYKQPKHAYSTINYIKDINTLNSIGNLIITYDTNAIKNSYKQYIDKLKGYILVIDPNGNVIFDSSNRYYDKKYPYLKLLKSTSNSVALEEESYININISASGAIIAGIVPKSSITTKTKIVNRTLLLFTIILIMIAILLTYFRIISFSRRTENIMTAMKKLQAGDLSVRIPLTKEDDELNLIASSFNNMCEDLNIYINKVYLSEIKQKNSELVALQSQINPHFLYNTLEVIRMRAISKGAHDVGQMIYILATLFRNSVKNKMIIPILQEINHCKLYLELFQIRYDNKLKFDINISDEILHYSIIKLSLQPIIENYIIHGIRLDEDDNFISITGLKQDNNIEFIISDNGKGIEKYKLQSLNESLNDPENNPSSSMGLTNVNERLVLMYGADYGLTIDSEENIGTSIHIKIPAKKEV